MNEVVVVIGAGSSGQAIARRVSAGKTSPAFSRVHAMGGSAPENPLTIPAPQCRP